MNKKIPGRLFLLGMVLLLAGQVTLAQMTASEIIRRVEDTMRGNTHIGTYEMVVVRPDWSRSIRMEIWSEENAGDTPDKSFIRILSPARDRGVGFLKIGREMWQYIPGINRVIKIPPSMMLQSWMGSDFKNDDLVQESSQSEDYTQQMAGSERIDGRDCYKIRLIAKDTAPVAWDRILVWVDKETFLPVKETYYNERLQPVRTITFSEVKRLGGRMIPSRMEVEETNEPGHKTVLIFEEIEFNQAISSSVFTQGNLRRSR